MAVHDSAGLRFTSLFQEHATNALLQECEEQCSNCWNREVTGGGWIPGAAWESKSWQQQIPQLKWSLFSVLHFSPLAGT